MLFGLDSGHYDLGVEIPVSVFTDRLDEAGAIGEEVFKAIFIAGIGVVDDVCDVVLVEEVGYLVCPVDKMINDSSLPALPNFNSTRTRDEDSPFASS